MQAHCCIFQHLGSSTEIVEGLYNGSHSYAEKLLSAKRPMIVVGSEALQQKDGAYVQKLVQQLALKLSKGCDDSEWKVYNVLQKVIHTLLG